MQNNFYDYKLSPAMSLINQTTDPTAYLGMRIQKRFGADFYPGKVADYEVVETAHGRRRLFFVQYDDGDEEHVSLTKFKNLMNAFFKFLFQRRFVFVFGEISVQNWKFRCKFCVINRFDGVDGPVESKAANRWTAKTTAAFVRDETV